MGNRLSAAVKPLIFSEPKIKDAKTVRAITHNADSLGSENAFGTIYLWQSLYGTKIAYLDSFLFKSYTFSGKTWFAFPVGDGDYKEALKAIFNYASQNSISPDFLGLTEKEMKILNDFCPGEYTFTPDRDSWEYIYNSQDLALLPGRKYHGKRNFVSRFSNTWGIDVKAICRENYMDAYFVAEQWCRKYGCGRDASLKNEFCSIKDAFKNFDALMLRGMILYADNKPVAMTVGEEVTKDLFVIHYEKALDGYVGAYQTINNCFAKTLTDYKFINREEDMGIEGMRKAKLSYYPACMLEKHEARRK